MKTQKLASLLGIWLFFTCQAGFAQDAIRTAPDLYWWSQDFRIGISDVEAEFQNLDARSDLWYQQKWGLSSKLYRSGVENLDLDEAEYLNLDFKRRIYSISDNTYLAMGLGWQNVELDSDQTGGARVLLEGRVGLGDTVYLYGQTAWVPEMDDFGYRSDVDGTEIEAGVSYDPLPNLSFRAGYRRFRIDYTNDLTNNGGSTESTGFVIGAGFNW